MRLRATSIQTQPRCPYTGRLATYETVGQLLRSCTEFGADDAFVLDFGLRAYAHWMVLDDLEPPQAGTWLTGEISLNVDHFAYMDELAKLRGMPPLIYMWTVDEIQLMTTPPIQVEHGHPLYAGPDEGPIFVADPALESWRAVDRTRAWEHEGSYRLKCTLENVEPTNSMALSGARSPYGPLDTSTRRET